MSPLHDLKINLNGQYIFFLNQDVISEYSGSLRKMIKQSKKKRNKKKKSPEIITIELDDFPGGPDGFELVSRFCYNNGDTSIIDVSNVSTLYCCSVYLGMTEKFCLSNLFLQTDKFLDEVFYGSWNDIVMCLKNCEQVFLQADSYGLVDKLIFAALTKISRNSETFSSSSLSSFASSLSPEMAKNTPESDSRYISQSVSCGRSNEWWFEDMSNLSPQIILKLVMIIGAYKTNIISSVLTRFLLHYLKTKLQTKSISTTELMRNKLEYSDLADIAVKGVISAGKNAFSCRKLFWVLRVLSSFSLSRESRTGLETLIGEMLEQATLDDLLISAGGSREGGFYDVDLVIRLLKVFVKNMEEEEEESSEKNMKDIGKLIDKYLREISPDQNLKVSKFLGVAESLPDSARECFDGVYRAIDIYLQSHPNLTSQDRAKICRCLNYKKLTMGTCKQLARNPKIPPEISIEALKSRCENQQQTTSDVKVVNKSFSCRYSEEKKKPVLLHLEISDKLADRLKTRGAYNWRVMDSFREGL
ncbi:PREDICTED: BTB/POZ domain-containing protein At1g50280-like [Camelina sativa]|uniref:BTB/POZ domain-containing protein At1g50280-like n=1 Tax=Camelina sativa TaxID=90675 RepID=A0ABM0YGL6_CAMSA|nr:PREDICTED: BTB/POZ domain-containing protein At1g50280-like [Camelina sativa]